MAMTVEMITVDCTDPDVLAAWWAEAAGGEVSAFAPGEFVVVIRESGPRLGFQKVPDVTPARTACTSTSPRGRRGGGDAARRAGCVGAGQAQLRCGLQLGRARRSGGQRVLRRRCLTLSCVFAGRSLVRRHRRVAPADGGGNTQVASAETVT